MKFLLSRYARGDSIEEVQRLLDAATVEDTRLQSDVDEQLHPQAEKWRKGVGNVPPGRVPGCRKVDCWWLNCDGFYDSIRRFNGKC